MADTHDKTFTIGEDDDGIRLDRWFKRHLPDVSFNIVSRWARTGQLRLDDKKATPGDRVAAGQRIRFPDPSALPDLSERPKRVREPLTEEEERYVRDMVIHEDRHGFVLAKPPGLATQGGTKTHQHLDRLLDGLVEDDSARPKLVHRLDKDTSGALLVARTSRSAAYFAKAFSSRTARKVYWALVVGVPSKNEGVIDLALAKQPGTGGEKMHISEEHGLAARTRWRVIDRAGNRAAWVELQPLTGRTHQLRVHMAALGHPIVGDAKYGGPEAFLTGGISRKMHLHARRIRVDAPDGDNIDVTANLPDHFAESLEMLGFDPAAGDRLPLEKVSKVVDPETAAKRVSAAAKARRKERKGERRSRGSSERVSKAPPKRPTKGPPKGLSKGPPKGPPKRK